VLVEDVPAGSRYALEGKLVDVTNNGDAAITVRFDALVPSYSTLRPGYELIPEVSWMGFEPRRVEIAPGATASTKLVVYAPEDPAYSGKRYQVNIHIRQEPGPGGGNMSVALMPRFMFSVAGKGAVKPALVDFPRKKAAITPYATSGRAEELVVECAPVTLGNPFDEPMTYDLVQAPESARKIDRREGLVPLDPSAIEASPRTVILPPRRKVEIAVRARIPLNQGIFGKTFAGPLHFRATRKGAGPVDVYNMVEVTVPALATGTATAESGGTR
jgi:hypothetical protein